MDFRELSTHFIPPDRYLIRSSAELSRAIGTTRARTAKCEACHLARTQGYPVPFSVPSRSLEGPQTFASRARYGVIGEAPGEKEVELGRPFVGKSGKYLRATMNGIGLDTDEGSWMNAVCCRPEGNATPDMEAMQSCRPNLMDSIKASNVEYLLLLGATALKAFRPDLKITQVHGMSFVWMDRYWVMPTYHPAAVLRDKSLVKPWRDDLTVFADLITAIHHDDIQSYIGRNCIRCIDKAVVCDRDGVPYCEIHYRRYGGQWKKARTTWRHPSVDTQRTDQMKLDLLNQ